MTERDEALLAVLQAIADEIDPRDPYERPVRVNDAHPVQDAVARLESALTTAV